MDDRGRLAAVDFRLLGVLEVRSDETKLALGGMRQKGVLALLLLHSNKAVSRDRLVDALWAGRPPETAANALQVAVHGLRKQLGRERLETRGDGYLLHVQPGELDLHRYEELVRQAREAGDSGHAARLLREALEHWRGPALADLRDLPFAQTEARRLEELRLAALEQHIQAELESGADAELVGELRALTAEEPYRERFHAQLMVALYRAGRQVEALETFQHARRTLVEELGVEPSPALQELERQVLRQDPALLLPPAPPPVRSPTNLPAAQTRLIGRELEVAAVTSLLREGDVRLLTLTGAGGTGKTRLGLAAAAELGDAFPDGVWFVALAPVRDPELVAPTIARALEVGESASRSVHEAVQEHLRGRRALLLLDNFEHVLPAAPLVADLLSASAELRVLVTSRSLLRLQAEHDYPVSPLPLPDQAQTRDVEALAHNEAAALFVERARAVRPGFRLEDDPEAVAEICHAVDGLPLALELAAARARLLPAGELRARLERRLPLLVEGPVDLPARQRTLRATIDWSHDLLEDSERSLLAGLSVFAGGWTLAAAEEVCDADLDSLGSLVDKSLLVERPPLAAERRFGMLETVREYAAERLAERREGDSVRRRHAAHFLALAEQAEPELTGPDAATWLARLDAEHDNLRAALGWAASAGDSDLELRLSTALQAFWRLRGHVTEGFRWLEDAVLRGAEAPAALRARALAAAGVVVDHRGDHDLAREFLGRALALFQELGDRGREARALSELGGIAALTGEYEHAAELFEKTIPLFEEAGDQRALMVTTANLSSVAHLQGDRQRGTELAHAALALAREGGDRDQIGILLHNLARGSLGEARYDDVVEQLGESIAIGVELGFKELIAHCLEGFAELAAARDDLDRAARLLGASEALLDEIGTQLAPEEQEGYERTLAGLEAEMEPETFAALRAEGRRLTLEAAVAAALEDAPEEPA